MSGARILRASLRCQSCQFNTLSAFAAVAGVTFTASRPVVRHRLSAATSIHGQGWSTRRTFATRHDAEGTKPELSEEEMFRKFAAETGVEEMEDEPATSQSSPTSQEPTVPWYLQTDPGPQQSPLAERQKLPELPENAPEKLPPIMQTLFTEIGLDDLRILDLRKMDPPQALGANLIMVFGTARSERHLHTSADRFCRWLRSTYKLRPYPDGLLGRNELKIRLRRKAKRAKIMGSKGTPEGEVDDGIRTGWVCVNVGAIEAGEEVTAEQLQAQGIVGFGEGFSGAHLVVQMMTEEKREELDLEKLWGDALARQERKEARMVREEEQLKLKADAVEDAAGEVEKGGPRVVKFSE